MKKYIITIIVVLACLAGIIFVLNKNKQQNEAETAIVAQQNASVAVRVDTARNEMMDTRYIANGTFLPNQELTLAAETNGRVVRVLVEEGARVSVGQTLATIEGDKLNVGVQNAQAVFSSAQADVERYESAYATGGVTKQQLDQMKLQFENAKNNLKSAQLTAADITIKSSINGIVNVKSIEPGSYVSPGTPAFEIVNVSTLKLRVNVDEKNVASLNVGQPIKVNVGVYPNREFEGKITFIAPKADNSLNFPVEIEIRNNPNNEIRAGMYGTAVFGDQEQVNALIIPRVAFVGSISSNDVFVVQDSLAQLVKVGSGRTFGDMVEVTGGLEAGDVVITSGQINLLNGTPVQIINK